MEDFDADFGGHNARSGVPPHASGAPQWADAGFGDPAEGRPKKYPLIEQLLADAALVAIAVLLCAAMRGAITA